MVYVFSAALLGGAYAAGVMVALLWPGNTPVPAPVWIVAFVGTFPVFGAGLICFKVARGGDSLRRWRRPYVPSRTALAIARPAALPGWLRLGAPALLAVTAVTLIVLALTPGAPRPGQPIVTADGRYALNNHGSITYVSHDEWARALELGQRGFVGIAMLFYTGSAFAIAAAIGLRPKRT